MKVLQIIHTQGHGGAEKMFIALCKELQKANINVIAAVPFETPQGKESWIISKAKEEKLNVRQYNKKGNPIDLLTSLRNVIKNVDPDIIHSHLLDSNTYSSFAAWLEGIPHVSTEHGDVSLINTMKANLKYSIVSIFSHIIVCVSEATHKQCVRKKICSRKLTTIYNGISFFNRRPSSIRDELNISDDAIIIGSVGNLYPIKGHKYLVAAFSDALNNSKIPVHLVIAGRGDEEPNLRKLANELRISPQHFHLLGFREDIENVMNSFDLYVQPSVSEGHPIAVLEAMSLEIPVVATAVGGIPEIVKENFGILVEPCSPSSLKDGIISYLHDPEKYRKKAKCASKFIERFSVQDMTHNYLKVYNSLLQRD